MQQVEDIHKILSKVRFSLENEKETQMQIEQTLGKNNVANKREFELDENSVIDFMIPGGIGIEVKIKGQKKAIYKQCERYCSFESITSLILVTSRSLGMLREINNKPVYVINISRAWL